MAAGAIVATSEGAVQSASVTMRFALVAGAAVCSARARAAGRPAVATHDHTSTCFANPFAALMLGLLQVRLTRAVDKLQQTVSYGYFARKTFLGASRNCG